MYFRAKRSGGFEYLQVVESHRVNGKPRQTVVATLGRLDALKESGELDRLLQSGARFTESGMLVSAFEKGGTAAIDAKRIGPPLLFERLWRDSGCRSVIEDLLGRGSKSADFGLHKRAETTGLWGPDFGYNGVLSGRRRASPGQARWGCRGPRPSRVSQCGWLWPVISSRGLLPLRSARRLRMKRRWFRKNCNKLRYGPPRWRRSVK